MFVPEPQDFEGAKRVIIAAIRRVLPQDSTAEVRRDRSDVYADVLARDAIPAWTALSQQTASRQQQAFLWTLMVWGISTMVDHEMDAMGPRWAFTDKS